MTPTWLRIVSRKEDSIWILSYLASLSPARLACNVREQCVCWRDRHRDWIRHKQREEERDQKLDQQRA